MPEMYFHVRWPDDTQSRCYSPSSTLREFFELDTPYPLNEFLARSRHALEHASERVRQRYGYACSSAASQLATIEHRAASFATTPNAVITVIAFDE
jgi:uncharacterized repeat protein (TIGR04042 family)